MHSRSLLPLLACLAAASESAGSEPDFFSPKAPTVPVNITGDASFDFLMMASMDLAGGGGAGIADILNAAHYIRPGDMESFANTFWSLANQTLVAADQLSKAQGNNRCARITTRDSYFAASTYYRMADFYLHRNPNDPRLKQLWAQQKSAFSEGLARLTSVTAQRITLPTKYNFTIPGVYYRIDNQKRPTIVITTGYDGPQEDFLHWFGPAVFDHGWNLLTYEGPGQPTVIHEQGIGFRPDWEVVMSPVLDWLEKQPTADMSKLTSIGLSLGGYLAARAAAFEPRVKALVLNGGVLDLYTTFSAGFGPLIQYLGKNNTKFDEETYKHVINNPKAATAVRWVVEQGLYTFHTRSPANWVIQSKAYNVTSQLPRIKVPTWVVNATADTFFPGQAIPVFNILKKSNAPVTLETFGGVAGLHDQIGAALELNRKMWTWLNGVWPNAVTA